MLFNDLVTFDKRAPEGWKQKLSLSQYNKLDDEKKKYYQPLYAKYKTKKRRSYDYDTGAYCGWEEYQVGIGSPTSYEYVGYFAARTIDQMLNSNVLMDRILNKPKKWDK